MEKYFIFFYCVFSMLIAQNTQMDSTKIKDPSVAWKLSLIPGVLSLIHISEPTRRTPISYAVFWLKKIFLMIRRPPRSTRKESSAASDVYKRQEYTNGFD